MGKWLNQIKEKSSKNALSQSDRVDTLGSASTLSTMSQHTLHREEKKSYINACKKRELELLIRKVSCNYGGDDENFLEEYINDVIGEWSYNLDAALACFRDLSVQKGQ